MEEIRLRVVKYLDIDFEKEVATYEGLVRFSTAFYRDVAEIYDSVTRIKNTGRNPTGFALNDAAILGLLVRIWKVLKEIVSYYEKNNGDIISLLDRQLIEAAVVAKFLLVSSDTVIKDYRMCSYKDRLRILHDAAAKGPFFDTPAGQRLLASVKQKMQREGLTPDSFALQRANKWRVQGKTFYQIFSEVEPADLYKYLYGIPSESIHGSWNDSMDYNLSVNEDETFSTYPFYQPVDIRFVSPLLRLCHDPFTLWLTRIDAAHPMLLKTFDWIQSVNVKLVDNFERAYATRGV